jgi:hypothetical protein
MKEMEAAAKGSGLSMQLSLRPLATKDPGIIQVYSWPGANQDGME